MKRKIDEENFEEAGAQAYRSWTETKVPSEVAELFDDPKLKTLNASCMHTLSWISMALTHPQHLPSSICLLLSSNSLRNHLTRCLSQAHSRT
jgi:hypothetical protein